MIIDARNYETSLTNVQREIEEKILFDKLDVEFEILMKLQAVFTKLCRPTYENYTKLDMDVCEMRYYKNPMGKD